MDRLHEEDVGLPKLTPEYSQATIFMVYQQKPGRYTIMTVGQIEEGYFSYNGNVRRNLWVLLVITIQKPENRIWVNCMVE